DGARGRAIKAPGPHEPLVPHCADLVFGCVGLDAIGKPLSGVAVHRPERLAELAAAGMNSTITPEVVERLVRSRDGLFKSAPPASLRVLLLNKADLLEPAEGAAILHELFGRLEHSVDAVALCSLADRRSPVVAFCEGSPR
ncbi:MAG TPA: selenium cofactor biosynthesis protein YqeC, partial [Rectinemataceae bacterium]|nr:selenium cofactor biosynthesis protein YqeC [Rectinemataceae bacterium]